MFKSTKSEIFVDQNNVKSNMSFDFNSNRFILHSEIGKWQ